MRTVHIVLIAAAAASSMVFFAPAGSHAGTIVGSGSISVWGRSTPYTSWDVLNDPLMGTVGLAEGRVRDFAFYNGRLYCLASTELQDGGPWYYTPGAAGSLATPIQPAMPFPVGTPWRFVTTRALAINTGGHGYGAFSGPDPVLVGVGVPSASGFPPQGFTLTQTAMNYAVGPLYSFPAPQGFAPQSIEYIGSLDRFVTVEADGPDPSRSVLNYHPHNAAGLLPRDSSVTLNIPGLKGITPVSAAFASMLSGQSITSESLLAIQKDNLGFSDPPRLYLLTLQGEVITQTDYVIPGWMQPRAIAVDEARGLIFTGDRELGQIHVLRVPAPGTGVLIAAAGLLAACRRRHASPQSK
ncbi:MAG: hypothetical protein H7210_12325 [Pyrinomonadaceae bacterium]|nr:hypothetical protein [Phycisphaerales bacterium]